MNCKIVTTATGAIAVFLIAISSAWACGPTAIIDMTLKNTGTVSWNNGSDDGKNYNDCPTVRIAQNTCGRDVKVSGGHFVNETDIKEVTTVELYWLDEPYFATGAGRTHADQQALAAVCRTFGVRLDDTPVSVTDGEFQATVHVPPTDTTYNGEILGQPIPRPVQTYPGANAICAVWDHNVSPDGSHPGDHSAAIGNQYTMYP